jgi:Tol biopolymer transport system component
MLPVSNQGDAALNPSWSTDGSKIAYDCWADVSSVCVTGSTVKIQTHTQPGWNGMPDFLPDGRIVFGSDVGAANEEIYASSPDGTHRTDLTNSPAADRVPSVSPDGRHIAFTRVMPDATTKIFVMRADGSAQRQVTTGPGKDTLAAWSPDGTHIAFQSDRDGDDEIYVTTFCDDSDAQCVPQTPLALTHNAWTDGHPTWSSATTVVFQSTDPGQALPANPPGPVVSSAATYGNPQFELWAIHDDGNGLRRLTTMPGPDIGPDGF